MAKKINKKVEPMSLQKKMVKYLEEDNKLMEKYNLQKRIVVLFPLHKKKIAPLLGRLALKLLKFSKGYPDIHFTNIDE